MDWDESVIDGHVRVGTMRGPGAVPVLFVPGRGDSLELRRGVGARLARSAARVVMVEHRGQGGSGRLGAHPEAVHVDDFDTHLHDLEQVLPTLGGPAHLVAHSMGGLLAAHLLARHPDRFTSAAISSPMWRFTQPLAFVRLAASVARALGGGRRFAAGEGAFDRDVCVEMRTSNLPGAAVVELDDFIAARPEMVRGGSTWGWVAAAASSMARLDRAPLARFRGPVAVASCLEDRTVSLPAHREITGRFPNGHLVELPCGHDPFFSADPEAWWAEVEGPIAGGAR